MITNYIRPQLLIRQLLEVLPAINEPSMNAFVYGAQYKLNRYYESEERATMFGTTFQSRGEDDDRLYVAYEGVANPDLVELSGVRLFGEDMELSYASFDDLSGDTETSPNSFYWNDPRRPNEIVCKDVDGEEINLYDADRGGLAHELDGRPVQIGDLVIVTENILAGSEDKVHRRRILDVKQSTENSSIGVLFCGPQNLKDSVDEAIITAEAIDGISNDDGISITFDNNSINTGSAFKAVGSDYGAKLKEKFSIRFVQPAYWQDGASVNGQARVRTVSNNFESDDVDVYFSDATTVKLSVPKTGIDIEIAGIDKINAGDAFDFTVEQEYDAFECTSGQSFDASISGTYLHPEDTTILATCLEGDEAGENSLWSLSDSTGFENVMEVSGAALKAGVSFGASGTTVKVNKVDHVAGEEFGWEAYAAGETGEYSVLVLDGPVGDLGRIDEDELASTKITKVEIRGVFAGEIGRQALNAPREQWTATEEGIRIEAELAYECFGFGDNQDESRFCKFVSENTSTGFSSPLLFASYRELQPALPDEKIIKVNTAADLVQFGKKDIENQLAFGAAAAFSGSQGKAIYVGRVETDDLAGYQEVLRKAQNIDYLYAHCPLTDDLDVQLEVRAHVDSMSNEQNKMWRRAYIATPAPSDYIVIGSASERATATITGIDDGNVLVTDTDGKFVSAGVKHGDMLRINFTSDVWGNASYDNRDDGGYLVHRVIDNETLILKSGPKKPINVARRYEIWKKDSAENVVDFVAARSSSIGSRRVSNIFCDGAQYLTDDDAFVTLHPMYLAAEIAGLRTAVLPQQGLTNTEISLVASAPSMYVKYTREQLDLIASNGSFLVVQEYDDGPRFIRHQLTTKTDLGNLYYEDSVGVNVDEISFLVKYNLRPYIGRRNVNPETLRDIFEDMFRILSQKTLDPGFGNSIGPSLIGFTDLVVRINDVFKDRIDVSAKLEVPLPLNVIDVTLNATASFNAGEITLESVGISRVGQTAENQINLLKETLTTDGLPVQSAYDS